MIRNVSVEFAGSRFSLLGRTILIVFAAVLVIPAPWLLVWFTRWFISQIKFSDGSSMTFTGRGLSVLMLVIPLLIQPWVLHFWDISYLYSVCLFPLNCFLGLLMFRWFWKNITPDCGAEITFAGHYFSFLGWNILLYITAFILGWPWVLWGMTRWVCRNIRYGKHTVDYCGVGIDFGGRTWIFVLSCFLIIPIPWTWHWLVKNHLNGVVILKRGLPAQESKVDDGAEFPCRANSAEGGHDQYLNSKISPDLKLRGRGEILSEPTVVLEDTRHFAPANRCLVCQKNIGSFSRHEEVSFVFESHQCFGTIHSKCAESFQVEINEGDRSNLYLRNFGDN